MMLTTENFNGCLLGGAVGDALGAPVEFMKLSEMRAKHGVSGVQDYVDDPTGTGRFTDDTQMTLFTAEGSCWLRRTESISPQPFTTRT